MHFAALAAGLATLHTATAFLIPPEASLPNFQTAEEQIKSSIASVFGADAEWHIELECPNCPWAGTEDMSDTQAQWSRDYETSLQIQISADSSNGLIINNIATLLTLPANPTPHSIPLVAVQKRLDTGATTPPFPIDYILERLPPVHSPTEPHRFLIPIKFTVVGFAAQPVHVDTLAIDLLATPHQLSVLRVQRVPFASTPGAAECPDDASTWSLCRVRAIVLHRVLETMRSMREGAHRATGWVKGGRPGCHRGGRGHMAAQGGHHDHQHHHNHRAHRWARMLHSTLRFFVIPALLGVIGGLLASAVGMLVGQFIVFLWLRVGRGGRRGPLRREEAVVVVRVQDEKRALLDAREQGEADAEQEQEDDALPRYADNAPPQYQDVEAQPREEQE